MVWGAGVPGESVGLEIVGPHGGILFQCDAAMPRSTHPVEVTFDVSGFAVEVTAVHEVRIFSRSTQLAFLLERVSRGALGLRRPRVRPMVAFDPE
jgi:hypothetical protein